MVVVYYYYLLAIYYLILQLASLKLLVTVVNQWVIVVNLSKKASFLLRCILMHLSSQMALFAFLSQT